jgi:DNA-binding XRE family transcriptional regulator
MDAKKLKALKQMGGRVTTVQEFLGLTNVEMAVIEARLELARTVRERRKTAGVTQTQLAKSVRSSQARIAKMEGGDPQASIESFIRALAALGMRVRLTVERDKRRPRKRGAQLSATS